ncbi:MAG TPA: hypothetical protein VFG45_05895 [Candidatus Nitrosocosmicus sp.]|nr:hypothetical protein [Candidatus Nitrosocosmicus sp.]
MKPEKDQGSPVEAFGRNDGKNEISEGRKEQASGAMPLRRQGVRLMTTR